MKRTIAIAILSLLPFISSAQMYADFYELLCKEELVTDVGYRMEGGGTIGVSYSEGRNLLKPDCDREHTTYFYIGIPMGTENLILQQSIGFGTVKDVEILLIYSYERWSFEIGYSMTENLMVKIEFRL